MKNLFKRLKSQKGMSGVLIAMLLVVVGVGLVAGVNSFMTGNDTKIRTAAAKSLQDAGVTNASADGS